MRLRPRHVTVAVAALAAVLPAMASSAPTVTEFSTGITLGAEPYGIASGPDGNLWFTENGLIGRIARLSPAGTVSEFSGGLTLFGGPLGITAGPDGRMWFTENSLAGSIGATSLTGVVAKFVSGLSLNGQLRHIASGPDGNLWATWSASPGRIVRITPTGTITQFSAGLTAGSQPSGIAPGPDGAMWFTEKGNPARIGRITTSGTITEFALPTAASAPEAIVLGPDGNMWFTQADGIGRITPGGVITEFTTGITPGSRPLGIAVGGDGALWFASSADPGRIGRITTAGLVTMFAPLTANSAPTGVTMGADGNIWFTQRTAGRIGRITVAPGVTPGVAGSLATDGATVTATVTPNSQATTLAIEYGTSAAYGASTAAVGAGAGSAPGDVAVPLTGLDPSTTYHYRTVATNPSGTGYGPDAPFTTLDGPAPPPPPPPGPPAPPPAAPELPAAEAPEGGRTVLAKPVSGTVAGRLPRVATPVPLDRAASLPIGAVIDATGGRVTITSALDDAGHAQRATFWAGAFSLAQPGRDGFVDIRLRGPLPVCGTPRARHEDGRRRGRSLWSKDQGGRYRTHGRNSVAVVRGTQWLVRERCDGTLTRVTDGAVAVRDLNRGRTVLVRARGKILVRAR